MGSYQGIFVAGIHEIVGERDVQAHKAAGEVITLQNDNVIGIDFPDSFGDPAVQLVHLIPAAVVGQQGHARVICVGAGLVHQVVTGNDGTALIALGKLLPQGHEAVLEMKGTPQQSTAGVVVGMPVAVLPSLHGMQIQNGVDIVLFAPVQGLVQHLEPLFLVHKGVHVVFKMPVVQRNAKQIHAQGGDIFHISLGEKIPQHAVEEIGAQLFAQYLLCEKAKAVLTARESVHKVLHVHPGSGVCTAQPYPVSGFVHNGAVFDLQKIHTKSSQFGSIISSGPSPDVRPKAFAGKEREMPCL